jgi:hemerythrin
MRSCEYDALQWHQQQHHAGRAKLALLMEAAHQKDLRSVSETLEEFTHWLRDHVGLADRMFAAHLRNDRRERLVS